MSDILKADPKKNIIIKGAKLHNLKNIDVVIPKNKLTVITGLSGSGKSTLAYDTLYAEGQRRYIESLSSYARQFMGKLNKPKVDYIKGISPTIAVEQKINVSNPRSTVGTKTEIYDYLKLLFTRIGKTYSPISNKIVKKESASNVIDFILNLGVDKKILLLCSVDSKDNATGLKKINILKQQGFARIFKSGEVYNLNDKIDLDLTNFSLVIDRLITKNNLDFNDVIKIDKVNFSYESRPLLVLSNISANSFTNEILISRWAFSIAFDASATLIDGAKWVPAVIID